MCERFSSAQDYRAKSAAGGEGTDRAYQIGRGRQIYSSKRKVFAIILLSGCIALPGPARLWAAAAPAPADYLLRAGDSVSVQAPQIPELTGGPLRIPADGCLELVGLGCIRAVGRTVESLQAEIKSKLSGRIRDPEIALTVVDWQKLAGEASSSSYVLGPDDLLSIRVLQAPELIEKPVRIDWNGFLDLPYIGRLRAAGGTLESLKADLESRLAAIVREPQVSVAIEEFRSQPVSVLGAVNAPGVHQIRGKKTLAEVLALAGGLRQDASNNIKITRRKERGQIAVDNAAPDATGQFSVATIQVRSLMEGQDPKANILVMPEDVITVPRAEMVYVIGDVARTGGFVLNERESMSLLEALSLAGGLNRTASPQGSQILRHVSGSASRTEIPVDIRKVFAGQLKDLQLQPEDILFIPSSIAKRASLRAIEAAIQVGTGLTIWGR